METTTTFEPTRERLLDGRVPAETADGCVTAEAVIDTIEPLHRPTILGLLELVLKDRPRLHRTLRESSLSSELIPRFLFLALTGFLLYGVSMTVILLAAGTWPELTSVSQWLEAPASPLVQFQAEPRGLQSPAAWLDGRAFWLMIAYSVGLVAATGVCLPSLYFYGLLSGIRMSMRDVVVHALKAKATSAVALIGILPVYAACGLAAVVFQAPSWMLHAVLAAGLILPFIAGFWGTRSLYVGFDGLCDTMRAPFRERRACFLRRLVVSWCACYTAVGPVMVFTLWHKLQG